MEFPVFFNMTFPVRMAVLTLSGVDFLEITLVSFILFYCYLNFIVSIYPCIEWSFRPLAYRRLHKHTILSLAIHTPVLKKKGADSDIHMSL